MFDAEQFFMDHKIQFTSTGKHSRRGWVQTKCPFCTGNPGWHLGINVEKGYSNCYRCGSHWMPVVVSTLAKTSIKDAKAIVQRYLSEDHETDQQEMVYAEKIKYPSGTGPMNKKQRNYLAGRGFDPEKLERMWELMGIGHVGIYKNRILVPIRYNNRLISYQTRDITDKHPAKYMAAKQTDEVFPHKDILYGIDHCKSSTLVLVEGITDVWRMGYGAGATSGIDYSPAQMVMIARRFKKVFTFFDDEVTAQQKVEKLSFELMAMNVEIENIINVGGDPGDLTDAEAFDLMSDLLGKN